MQNCEALQKQRFFAQDKKNRYGKADAYRSGFLKYWVKRLILKRILSYETPPNRRPCFLLFHVGLHDAIKIENNLAVIDYSICTSCGLCAAVCPKKLIASPIDTPEEVLAIVKAHMKK